MQLIYHVTLISILVVMVTATSDSDWSIQWYDGEPYQLDCDLGNNTDYKSVTWDTPSRRDLSWPLNDDEFQIMNVDSTKLLIKSLSPSLHGVYICTVYNTENKSIEGRHIYGINIHEAKYTKMLDKYRHNLTVAGIASGSFLALVTSLCLVWNFRYISADERQFVERKHNMYARSTQHQSTVYENNGYDTISTQL